MKASLKIRFGMTGLTLAAFFLLAIAGPETPLSYFAASDPVRFGDEAAEKIQAPSDCPWVKSTFRTFSGTSIPVWSTQEPIWNLELGEIRSVNIHEAIPYPGVVGSPSYVFAQIEVSDDALRRIDPIRNHSCGNFVIIRQGDHDFDLSPLRSAEPHLLPGGTFRSRTEAEHFYSFIKDRISYFELSAKNREYWLNANQELIERAIWYVKCDPEYLKILGDGLYEMTLATPKIEEKLERVQCESGPPKKRVPEQPETSATHP